MVRVKLPFGGVTPEQMEAFASVVEKYAPLDKGHITTRQNIQIHHVPLRDMESLLREISAVDLSSREGCGNTVRNVTGDPWAGVAPDEVFDPTPYAGAYVRYFVRHPTTQLMPRKIKTAFTGSDEDRAITGIHDIAFLSRERDGVKGFEVGSAAAPRSWPASRRPSTSSSRPTTATTSRSPRRRCGSSTARSGCASTAPAPGSRCWSTRSASTPSASRSRRSCRASGPTNATSTSSGCASTTTRRPTPRGARPPRLAQRRPQRVRRFVEGNVQAQRQEGFSAVEVKIDRGDLTPEQFRGLAAIMREFTGGYARSTVQQNLVLRWVRDEALYDVWERLTELGLGEAGAREITDVVSCPGTDSCKLGITSSMGLNRAIKQRVEEMEISDDLTRKIHIKMSGCPNGCSQHHIANIGFYGASLKVGGRQMPAYIPHIAGNYEGGEVIFGTRLKSRLPAKRVPEAVERWIRLYEAERAEGEEFNAFAERAGAPRFEEEIKDLTLPAEFSLETMQQFIDWNRSSPYKVERGEGECAI
jgi:sulfite reductase beta subunit-like hemoprotein